MINSAQQYPVHALLNEQNKVQYQVPRYQREYSWQRSQWEDLFEDLVEADGSHFLGTIIALNTTKDSAHQVTLEVIDGQQRLTTLTILLAAIHHALRSESNPDEELIVSRSTLGKRLVIEGEPRLLPQVQGSNQADYLAVLNGAGLKIDGHRPSYFGLRRISRCFDYFSEALVELSRSRNEALTDTATRMLDAVLQAVIVKIEVASHADAFILFESLNNRGMPLTPVDLIKNHILAESEKRDIMTVDEAFAAWNVILGNLGGEYANHERFLRHFYNAFKGALPSVDKAPVATRARLIRIYEQLLKEDFAGVLSRLSIASATYGRITGDRTLEQQTPLDEALQRLGRVQGVPSYVLALWLLVESDVPETQVTEIVRVLESFFVRRNLSGTPQTYALPTLFMSIIEDLSEDASEPVELVRNRLAAISVDDTTFRSLLDGPIYNVNVEVARFILASIEEQSMTAETTRNLWERLKNQYAWTIEHIFPQGANLPAGWVSMMGGAEMAAAAQEREVHRLGNLTITRYNSTLGNKTFEEKRDRADSNGNPIGYRNGLSLNRDLAEKAGWTLADIEERTALLADRAVSLFPLRP